MSIRILEDFNSVQAFLPKYIVLEFLLSYPDAKITFNEHWFIYDLRGNVKESSTDILDSDVLTLAAFAWRVRQMRMEVQNNR